MMIESKLTKVGNSLYLHVPSEVKKEWNISKGDRVKVDLIAEHEHDSKGKVLIVLKD